METLAPLISESVAAGTNFVHNNGRATVSTHPNNSAALHLRQPFRVPEESLTIKIDLLTPLLKPNYTNDTVVNNESCCDQSMMVNKNKMRKKKKKNAHNIISPTCTISDVLRLMDALQLRIPPELYASLINECTETSDSIGAMDLHAHISRYDRQQFSLPLMNRLLLMHVSCGRLDIARQVFDEMVPKDFKSWAIMVIGCVQNSDYSEAISYSLEMLYHISMLEHPAWFMACLLKACIYTKNIELGKQVHCCSVKLEHANDLLLASTLINFYGKFKCLEDSNLVFNQVLSQSSQTWMAKLIQNSKGGHFFEAIRDFREIGKAGVRKNTFMISSTLRACARMQDDGYCGRQVHANAIKLGVESNTFVQCGLVDMYGRSGLLSDAKGVFKMISDRGNAACWNAMLKGYLNNGLCVEAIKFLYEMKAAGLQLQESLLDEVRFACGSTTTHQS